MSVLRIEFLVLPSADLRKILRSSEELSIFVPQKLKEALQQHLQNPENSQAFVSWRILSYGLVLVASEGAIVIKV